MKHSTRSTRARLSILLGLALATAAPSLASASPPGALSKAGKIQIVVDAHDALSDEDVRKLGRAAGVDLALNSVHSDEANLYVAWVDADRADQVMEAIRRTPGVESAEPNALLTIPEPLGDTLAAAPRDAAANSKPNDPLYQYQWHFDQIDVEGAWKKSTGKGVIVAVIDTGVAYKDKGESFTQTPDLKGTAFVPGFDFVDDDDEPLDEHGHGTHVAGTIAQTTNNGYGVAGVAYNARIMPLRVLNKNGSGSVSDISDSIRFAADKGAKVINMSLGGPLPSLAMRSAIQYAHEKGVTIVAAAGNSGRRMRSFPAAYNHVIAVAATQYDRKTTFYSQWGEFVDIAAPGGNTRVDQNRDGRPDGVMQQTLKPGSTAEHDFALYMGTSMASPHVAAVAALIIANGTTNPDKVEQILKDSADSSDKDKIDKYTERFGAGILNANGATGSSSFNPGLLRIGVALLLLLIIFVGLLKKGSLGAAHAHSRLPLAIGLVMGASGLFFLPALLAHVHPDAAACALTLDLLSRPLAMLDLTLLGPGAHQNALLASVAIPLGALAIGLAIGFAGFLLAEAWMMNSDVQWIPGSAGLLDRAWLVANGLLAASLAHLGLKRQ